MTPGPLAGAPVLIMTVDQPPVASRVLYTAPCDRLTRTMHPTSYPTIDRLADLSADHAARVAAAVALVPFRIDPYRTAAAYGIPPALFDEAMTAGRDEIDRLAADPTAAPREDLAGAVVLSRFVGAVADLCRPAALLALYEAGERGDEDAREILERHAGASWPAIVAAVEAVPARD